MKFITDYAIGALYLFAAYYAAFTALKWGAASIALFQFAARRFVPDP